MYFGRKIGQIILPHLVLNQEYKIFDLDLFVYLLCLSIYFSQDFQIPSLTHPDYLVVD